MLAASCAFARRALSSVVPPIIGPSIVTTGSSNVTLPRERITATFSRSSGAGGQNVNKVNTKAEVRFSLADADWMAPDVRARFSATYGAFVNAAGEVFVTSQKHRSQESNLADALDKLRAMVRKAAAAPKVRLQRTALSELSKEGYREDKRRRSVVKERRKGAITWDE
jgi:peptidyl-tRNA hydrolase ICT1